MSTGHLCIPTILLQQSGLLTFSYVLPPLLRGMSCMVPGARKAHHPRRMRIFGPTYTLLKAEISARSVVH